MPTTKLTRLLAPAALIMVFLAAAAQASEHANPAAPALAAIEVSYLYVGERWVSPPAYAMTGPSVSVKTIGRDARGNEVTVDPVWTGDPAMVDIAPSRGPEVTITALKPGLTDVVVTSGDVATRLSVSSVQKHGIWRVAIADRSPVAIKVAYLLDPRITQGAYMGERWLSRPAYSIRASSKISVKTIGLDAMGRAVKIDPTWTGDPDMVSITPSQGPKVTITVLKPGRSDVVVTSGNVSKKLSVMGAQEDGVWRVEVSEGGGEAGRTEAARVERRRQ